MRHSQLVTNYHLFPKTKIIITISSPNMYSLAVSYLGFDQLDSLGTTGQRNNDISIIFPKVILDSSNFADYTSSID